MSVPSMARRQGSVQRPIAIETVLFVKTVPDHPDEGRELFRRDRIEDVPDLDIRRNIMRAEEGLDVIPAGGSLRISLERKIRRAVG